MISDKVIQRFEKRTEGIEPDENGCLIFPGTSGRYGTFRVDGKVYTAHRVSCEIAHGEPGPEHQACHRCDIKSCCNPDHLYWGMPLDNGRDRMERGLVRKSKYDESGKLLPQYRVDFQDLWDMYFKR